MRGMRGESFNTPDDILYGRTRPRKPKVTTNINHSDLTVENKAVLCALAESLHEYKRGVSANLISKTISSKMPAAHTNSGTERSALCILAAKGYVSVTDTLTSYYSLTNKGRQAVQEIDSREAYDNFQQMNI